MNQIQLSSDINKTKEYFKEKYGKEYFFKNQYYYGYDVFFSYLKKNATFWIIGNNPGIGYYSLTEKIREKSSPLDYNEYFSPKNDKGEIVWYNVASSFWNLFNDNIGDLKLLEKDSVITNLHFFITENFNQLNRLINNFSYDDKLFYNNKINEWNLALFKIINPKIILSFGDKGFEFFDKNFNLKEVKKFNKGHENREHKYYTINDKCLIKIKRTISGIENRQALGEMIIKELSR